MAKKACINNSLGGEGSLFAEFILTLRGPTAFQKIGMQTYQAVSKKLGRSGLLDFLDVFPKTLRITPDKAIRDALHIFGEMDGLLTDLAREKLINLLWRGGKPDSFEPTLGVLYTLREIEKRGLAGGDVLYLVEVPDPNYGRRVDILAHLKQLGDTPSLTKIRPEDVAFNVEVKWYAPDTAFDTAFNIEEVSSDLIRAYSRNQNFDSLYYAFPDDYPADQLADAADMIMRTFDDHAADAFMDPPYGLKKAEIDALRAMLNDRIGADLILQIPNAVE